ncbi:hypothetical protein [Arthrobacter sp. 7Tela_A1]|uniref:hypothetical protein n=1 Tax=Arthrobacter sp. 7Tela_A1 TaxID=3093745 RepID=UPI003BB6C67F
MMLLFSRHRIFNSTANDVVAPTPGMPVDAWPVMVIDFESFAGPLADWFQKFTLSPGLAGIFAVCAAYLAFIGVRGQTKSNEEQKRKDQWWSTYTWVFDTVTDPKTHKNGLKKTAALNVLMHLMQSGHSRKQIDLLDSMKDLLESTSMPREETSETAPAAEPQPSPRQFPLDTEPVHRTTRKASGLQDFDRRFEQALTAYDSQRESLEIPNQPFSVFENNVAQILNIRTAPVGIQLKSEVRVGGMLVDLVAISDDRVVIIDLKMTIQRGRFSRLGQLVSERFFIIDGKEFNNVGVIVVTNENVVPALLLEQWRKFNFDIIPWRNGHNLEQILALLKDRLKAPQK